MFEITKMIRSPIYFTSINYHVFRFKKNGFNSKLDNNKRNNFLLKFKNIYLFYIFFNIYFLII